MEFWAPPPCCDDQSLLTAAPRVEDAALVACLLLRCPHRCRPADVAAAAAHRCCDPARTEINIYGPGMITATIARVLACPCAHGASEPKLRPAWAGRPQALPTQFCGPSERIERSAASRRRCTTASAGAAASAAAAATAASPMAPPPLSAAELDAYLQRIGWGDSAGLQPSLEILARLMRLHQVGRLLLRWPAARGQRIPGPGWSVYCPFIQHIAKLDFLPPPGPPCRCHFAAGDPL